MLKPQDIVVLLKIIAVMVINAANYPDEYLSQNKLANFLCMSVSEVNAGIKRLLDAGLLSLVLTEDQKNETILLPNKKACEECLISGVKYFFPGHLGSYTRGIATSYAAPILEKHFVLGEELIPVWPYQEGDKRGLALEPLYSSVPKSITQFPDETFYELLVLIDAIRSGRTRERNIAANLLRDKINDNSQSPKNFSKHKNVRIRGQKIK